jgi:cytochrome c biogenesis protein CcmG/thiol:disulfide interchange protein DsbE
MKRWGVLVGFLVVSLLLVAGIYISSRDPGFTRAIPSPLIGKAAPDFVLPDLLDPQRKVSTADYKGKVWMLNVWGSWCPECWKEHGYLAQLAKEQDVLLVGLNWRDERADALNMLKRAGNPYVAIGTDPHSSVAVDWGVYGAPETFIVDKQGIIRHKHTGAITPQVWESEIRPLLKKLAAEG